MTKKFCSILQGEYGSVDAGELHENMDEAELYGEKDILNIGVACNGLAAKECHDEQS